MFRKGRPSREGKFWPLLSNVFFKFGVNFFLPILCLFFLFQGGVLAQEPDDAPPEKPDWVSTVHARSAFVADGALAALRKEPQVTASLKQRLRVGRRVYILQSRRNREGQLYVWVAVTRRTRGWLDARALVTPNRRGDDERLMSFIKAETNEYERLRLSRLFLDAFSHSKLLPQVLLLVGQAADSEASVLTKRADRRVREVLAAGNADAKSYFENDSGLDRYNRLGVMFRYQAETGTYRYDGWAYRQLLTRFPQSSEAAIARQKIQK